jgi:hypothetical protein
LELTNQLLQAKLNTIYHAAPKPPRFHPIIDVIGEEWERAETEGRSPDLEVITRSKITEQCREGLAAHPEWSRKLTMVNLPVLLWTIPPEDIWWLPPPDEQTSAGM